MIIELVRLYEGPHGTFGAVKLDKIPFCVSLEPKDLLNKPNVSCIPGPQQYTMKRYMSTKFGETFIVDGVPDRFGILWHPGNFVQNTEGCILIGSAFYKFAGPPEQYGIKNSGDTFKLFMERMSGIAEALLTITYAL